MIEKKLNQKSVELNFLYESNTPIRPYKETFSTTIRPQATPYIPIRPQAEPYTPIRIQVKPYIPIRPQAAPYIPIRLQVCSLDYLWQTRQRSTKLLEWLLKQTAQSDGWRETNIYSLRVKEAKNLWLKWARSVLASTWSLQMKRRNKSIKILIFFDSVDQVRQKSSKKILKNQRKEAHKESLKI